MEEEGGVVAVEVVLVPGPGGMIGITGSPGAAAVACGLRISSKKAAFALEASTSAMRAAAFDLKFIVIGY